VRNVNEAVTKIENKSKQSCKCMQNGSNCYRIYYLDRPVMRWILKIYSHYIVQIITKLWFHT